MTVHKLFIKPLVVPVGAELEANKTYEFVAPEKSLSFKHMLGLKQNGKYELEYWATDDVGNLADKKTISCVVKAFVAPQPVVGAVFAQQVAENSVEARMVHGKMTVLFKREREGLGENFYWPDLDLRGVSVKDNLLTITPGCWLYNAMTTKHRAIDLQFAASKDGVVSVFLGQEYKMTQGGQLLPIPAEVASCISGLRWENGLWCCRLLKPVKIGISA